MKQVIGIRCNLIGNREHAMREYLSNFFDSECIYYLIDNRSNHPIRESNAIILNQDIILNLSLYPINDWGWRCGDYFYYQFRKNIEADYYYLVEPDVEFSLVNPNNFFDKCNNLIQDFLGVYHRPRATSWFWYNSMSDFNSNVYGCIFAFSRLSGRSLDYLYNTRVTCSKKHLDKLDSVWANDEAFVSTMIANSNTLSAVDLSAEFVGFFSKFGTRYQYLTNTLPLGSGVVHPVLGWEDFKIKFRKRYDAALRNNNLDIFLSNSLYGLNSSQIDELLVNE